MAELEGWLGLRQVRHLPPLQSQALHKQLLLHLEVTAKIAGIQAESQSSAEAIREIDAIIHQLSTLQATITHAVDGQSAATQEISQNIQRAAQGSANIAGSITQVATSAKEVTAGTHGVQGAARELADLAVGLDRLMGRFNPD